MPKRRVAEPTLWLCRTARLSRGRGIGDPRPQSSIISRRARPMKTRFVKSPGTPKKLASQRVSIVQGRRVDVDGRSARNKLWDGRKFLSAYETA